MLPPSAFRCDYHFLYRVTHATGDTCHFTGTFTLTSIIFCLFNSVTVSHKSKIRSCLACLHKPMFQYHCVGDPGRPDGHRQRQQQEAGQARRRPRHAGQAGRARAGAGRPDAAASRHGHGQRPRGARQHGGGAAGALRQARLPHAHVRPGGGGRAAAHEELHYHVLCRQDARERHRRQQEGRQARGGAEDDRQAEDDGAERRRGLRDGRDPTRGGRGPDQQDVHGQGGHPQLRRQPEGRQFLQEVAVCWRRQLGQAPHDELER